MNTAKLHRSSASPNNPTERPVFRSKLNDGQWDIASSCHANLPSIALSSDPAAARELLRSLRAPPFLQEKLLITKINQYDSMLRVSWFCSQPHHHLGGLPDGFWMLELDHPCRELCSSDAGHSHSPILSLQGLIYGDFILKLL